MKMNDVWNSSLNAPTQVERNALVQHVRDTVRRIQRRRAAFLTWTGIALLAVTSLVVYVWATGRADVISTWGLGLLLAAQWAVFFLSLRQAVGTARKPVAAEASIRESLETLLRESEHDRRGLIAVLALFAVAAPVMEAAVVHLHQIGKMAAHEAWSAGAMFSGVFALSVTVMLVRLWRRVLPRRRRIQTLLQQYREE